MKNKTVVTILLIFIVGIFLWIGYVLFFPKTAKNHNMSFVAPSFQVEAVLSKKVVMDHVRPLKMEVDPFAPLIVNLYQEDLVNLLKVPLLNFTLNRNLRYLSGVKGHEVNMVTLSFGGKSLTFDFDKANTRFSWKKKNYVVVYFDPTLEGAVIMDLSNGKLYTVTSQGLIIK